MAYIKISNVSKTYKDGENVYLALKNINLEFNKNEFIAVLGESGSGKSTLLNLISGISDITKGNIYINGQSIKTFSKKRMNQYRKEELGIIFQKYNLIDLYNIYQNIDLVRNENIKENKIIKLLENIGIKKKIKNKINENSGGELQRAALIRAIINNPSLLLLDEPTGALDKENCELLMNYLMSIKEDKLIIFVTHNKELASKYATRIIEIKDGEIVKDINNSNVIKEKDENNNITQNMRFKYKLIYIINMILKKKGRFIISILSSVFLLFFISISLITSSLVNDYINASFLSSLDANVLDIKSYNIVNRELIEIDTPTLIINELDKNNNFTIRKNYNNYLNDNLLNKLDYKDQGKSLNLNGVKICCMSNYFNDKLLIGDLPKTKNEVVVNENLYNYLSNSSSIINKRFLIKDSNEYLKISGVSYSSLMNDSLVIYFDYELISKELKDLNINTFQIDIKDLNKIDVIIKELKNSNLYIEKENIQNIEMNYSFDYSIDLENYYLFYELINLAKVVVYLFLGLTLMISVMLLSNVIYSFNEEEKRNIAILKVLGFSYKDIAVISLLVGFIIVLISYLINLIINKYLNDNLSNYLSNYLNNKIDCSLLLSFEDNLYLFIVVLLLVLLSSIFPLIKLNNIKIDNALKEE